MAEIIGALTSVAIFVAEELRMLRIRFYLTGLQVSSTR